MALKIPITFNYKGSRYTGTLEAVHGAGTKVYHLMIDKLYYGRLRQINDAWVFDTNKGSEGWEELADFFGRHVDAAMKHLV